MPYIIKNGLTYTGNLIPITQAQYEALSEAEKNNGIAYFIVDSDAVLDASDVGLGTGSVETLAGSVAVIETSPATAIHAVGDFILWDGQLYTVIAPIRVGQDLTVGSNITATSAGSEISALKGLTTYSTGDLTKVSSNISAVEYSRFMRVGNVAWVTANFTIGTAITDSTPVLFSGAPHARRYLRSTGMMVNGQSGRYVRYEINTEGQIRGSYTNGGIAIGMYEITLCYPCQD